jgi:hypothetical protein
MTSTAGNFNMVGPPYLELPGQVLLWAHLTKGNPLFTGLISVNSKTRTAVNSQLVGPPHGMLEVALANLHMGSYLELAGAD